MASLKDLMVTGNAQIIGDVYGNKFVTNGGSSSDFVKGDGSLDSSTYLTSATTPVYTIVEQVTPTTGYLKTYKLQKDGADITGSTVIDIPKDFLVQSGEVIDVVEYNGQYYDSRDTAHENPLPLTAAGKYIDFVVNVASGTSTDQHIYIAVDDLVDVYTEGDGIEISNTNEISIDIDSSNSNGLSVSANGLALDMVVASSGGIGGSAGAMSATDKEKLDGISAGAEVNVQSDWNQTDDTADDYIKNKPTALSDFTDDIGVSGKADKVSGATNGNFAGLDSTGNLTDSGVSVSDIDSRILLPNFDEMTPAKTIEYDLASTSYYQIFSRDNTNTSETMSEVNDVVLLRITVTGTNIYAKYDLLVKYRSVLGAPFVAYFSDTYNVSAGTSGLYYIRFIYPKARNNGYDWLCDFRSYNATARHIKIDVFSTTDAITWYETLTPTTLNNTYQDANSGIYPYDKRYLSILGTVSVNASTASTAQYTTAMHVKYFNSSLVKAGEPLIGGYMLYISNRYAYKLSNKDNPIDTDFGINHCNTTYSLNGAIGYQYFREQSPCSFTLDTGLTYDEFVVGDRVYLRCNLIGDKIYSDAHLSKEMTPGYTWYMLGATVSATQLSLNTSGSIFITLDENGMVSHINGNPTQSSLMNGSFERLFCGNINSTVDSTGTMKSATGRSMVFNQIVGDVTDDTTGWVKNINTTTISASDGVISIYNPTGYAGFGVQTTGTNGSFIKNHKYYFSVFAKSTREMNAYAPWFGSTYATVQNMVANPRKLTTEWQRFTGILNCPTSGNPNFGIRNYTSSVGETTLYMKNAMLIDLTKMFGSGNEPTDISLLDHMFQLDYYNYNLGGTLLGGTQTGFKSEDGQGNTLTNLSIPVTTLTGTPSGGTSEVMFPNGLLGIGDVRDEIDFENGTAVKRIGCVDLGTLSWTRDTSGTYVSYYASLNVAAQIPTGWTNICNVLCQKFLNGSANDGCGITSGVKDVVGIRPDNGKVVICPSASYSTASDFTTAVDGTYLIYILSTSVEYILDTVPNVEYETERGGTEQWLPVNTSVPTVAPICCISRYQGENVGETYTAGDGIDISEDNEISIDIDSSNSNGLSVSANGLALDMVVASSGGIGGSAGAMSATDKEKLDGISKAGDTEVQLNGVSGIYGIFQKSLCAFAYVSGASMCMTSLTTSGGTGQKSPYSSASFPIGCKIYYNDGILDFPVNTIFDSKKFMTTFKYADARYSAIDGENLSLESRDNSSVYLMVTVADGMWSPYYKSGQTNEIIVTTDQLILGKFYIYLGKTVGSTGYEFQLEDNNPLYYYDGSSLIDWPTYIAEHSASVYSAGPGIDISPSFVVTHKGWTTRYDLSYDINIDPSTSTGFSLSSSNIPPTGLYIVSCQALVKNTHIGSEQIHLLVRYQTVDGGPYTVVAGTSVTLPSATTSTDGGTYGAEPVCLQGTISLSSQPQYLRVELYAESESTGSAPVLVSSAPLSGTEMDAMNVGATNILMYRIGSISQI